MPAFNETRIPAVPCTVPAEDVTRVKGLGFLRDKTTPDCFNARVITRNGKITAEESRILAEAAERWGSGEVAMTTRLTIEIQRIPYENIEPLCAFLAEHGLETGGTGAKVRPVVSCKGTTCQFGLIDTFDLSRKIHERFYQGWHTVKLPHKCKIAVGGCPNNCAKPDLNDIGIIGQRIPSPDADLCKGCKTCQVEKGCPMKAARVVDGKITLDRSVCNNCGRCVGKCPFHVFDTADDGVKLILGGRWGKKGDRGQTVSKVYTSEEEVMYAVEKALAFYRDSGIAGERLSETISRVGWETVDAMMQE